MSFRKRHFYFLRRLVLGLAVAAIAAPAALGAYPADEAGRSATARSATPQWLQALNIRSEALNHLYGLQQPGGVNSVPVVKTPQWLRALTIRSEALNHLYNLDQPRGVTGIRPGGQIPQGLLPNGSTIEQLHRNPDAASPAVYSTGTKAPEPRPIGRGYFGASLPSDQGQSNARVDFGDSATGFGIAAGLGLLAAAAMMLRNRRKLATGF